MRECNSQTAGYLSVKLWDSYIPLFFPNYTVTTYCSETTVVVLFRPAGHIFSSTASAKMRGLIFAYLVMKKKCYQPALKF